MAKYTIPVHVTQRYNVEVDVPDGEDVFQYCLDYAAENFDVKDPSTYVSIDSDFEVEYDHENIEDEDGELFEGE